MMALNSDTDKKVRLSVYLESDIMRSLADYATRRDKSRSLIAESAIASFLSPDADERREAATTRRLDGIDRHLQRLERDLGIAVEMLAIFIRFWLASTPQLPDTALTVTRAKGSERYDNFIEALGRRLAKGPKLWQEIGRDSRMPAADCEKSMDSRKSTDK
jgi:predicted transcriptional regulator